MPRKKQIPSNNEEPLIVLQRALARIKEKWPDAPIHALRDRVRRGEIPSRRSSDLKGARWFVRESDLVAALPQL